MSKLIALLSVYNAQDLIYEALTSLLHVVDEIRVYDGRYSEYACECGKVHDQSCDKTYEEFEKWRQDNPSAPPSSYRHLQAMSELQKRTKMFNDMLDGEVALVLDDDELFFGNPEILRNFANHGSDFADLINQPKFAYIDFLFAECGHGTGATIPLPRLFVKTPGLRYERTYYEVYDDAGLVVNAKADNVGVPYGRRARGRFYLHPSARIVALWNFRGKKRTAAARKWLDGLGKSAWGNT